jgi:predicted RNase H-like HicB family nuclease
MNSVLWERAEELAARQYTITIEQDTLSNGQVVFVARHPDLPGCKAQGHSLDEAKKNLDEARVDYIYALLTAGLEIPAPTASIPFLKSQSIRDGQLWIIDAGNEKSGAETLDAVNEGQREPTFSISLQGDLIKQH